MSRTASPARRSARPPRSTRQFAAYGTRPGLLRSALSGLGQLMITAGLVLLLFCVYELYVTNLFAARDQTRLSRDLTGLWATPAPPVTPAEPGRAPAPVVVAALPAYDGSPFARLYAPRLSGLHPLVVVEGVGVDDLRKGGPGHLPGSAQPGAVGNVVLSGHRTTYGAPFGDLDRLAVGDALVLETRDSWFTYRVTGSRVVAPTAIEVTLPVPGKPGVAATEADLTLTTCNPKYSATQRLIISAVLQAPLAKAGGSRPDALRGA